MKTQRLISLLVLTSAFGLRPLALVSAAPLGTAFTYQVRLLNGGNPASSGNLANLIY